ncbi:hypothetical protein HKX48_005275 [Thoreauomyces humboldtii]|nr:hypothetical protein HKX48_005275 [Thoreauomyces humboldtii]
MPPPSRSGLFASIPNVRFFFTRQWLPAWILAGLSVVGMGFFVVFRVQIVQMLTEFADTVRRMGVGGWLLMTFLQFLSCFPPLVGYGTLLYMCGFIFGFPWGWIPAFVGSWLGGVTVFLLSRRYLGPSYRAMLLSHFPKFRHIESAVETGGLKLVTLVRLAPYPFGIMSILFATTAVPQRKYVQATSLALVKTLLHVYIGSTVRDLAETSEMTPARIAVMVFGTALALGVFVYLTVLVRKTMRETEAMMGGDAEEEEAAGEAVLLREGGGLGMEKEDGDGEQEGWDGDWDGEEGGWGDDDDVEDAERGDGGIL